MKWFGQGYSASSWQSREQNVHVLGEVRTFPPSSPPESFPCHPQMNCQLPPSVRAPEDLSLPATTHLHYTPMSTENRCFHLSQYLLLCTQLYRGKCVTLRESWLPVIIGCIFSKSEVMFLSSVALLCSRRRSILFCLSSLPAAPSSPSAGRSPGHSKLLPLGWLPKIHKEQISVPDLLQKQTAKKPL